MANWFTRMWKYAPEVIGKSEYLIHATLYFGTELTDDIFAFGNCYDAREYKNYFLFCPYAYRYRIQSNTYEYIVTISLSIHASDSLKDPFWQKIWPLNTST